MNDLAQLLSSIEITDKVEIRTVLLSFLNEYNHQGKVFDKSFLERIGSTINALTRKRVPWQLSPFSSNGLPLLLVKEPSHESKSVLNKIGRMVMAEGASEFNRVNDYARIAAHVYGNRKESILSTSWKCIGNQYKHITLDDEKSGLQAALYCKQDAIPQYVYAIAGTKGADAKDWKANLGQVVGISDQYKRAGEIAERLAYELGTRQLTMVGHSKGGGQAAYCALRTGCRAITFNPAGLGLIKFKNNKHTNPDINSYVMVTDYVNLFQMVAQLMHADITADGSVHYLKSAKKSTIRDWHGINGFLKLGGMTNMHLLECQQ